MKKQSCFTRVFAMLLLILLLSTTALASGSLAERMADFDPGNPILPEGDTIRIGYLNPLSGPASINGEIYFLALSWVTHDINQQGGIYVDGKYKKIRIYKGDTMSKPARTKKVAERLILKHKVHILWGTTGSHLSLIISQVAKKYKVIYHNALSVSDILMDRKNFNRYTFHTPWTTSQIGVSLAYFYANRPETRFYILCQDYFFGHALAESFKKGLKQFKPDAKIVGEDYHPLFTKDFAPYLTKLKAAGAEVIFTGDWMPDATNLIRQAREFGIGLPFANVFVDDPITLKAIGIEGSRGLVNANQFMIRDDSPQWKERNTTWNKLWKTKWSKPYDKPLYRWPIGTAANSVSMTYWMMHILKKAGSTNPEKIIAAWEGDEWHSISGPLKMRACDHRALRNTYVSEFDHPNPWFEDFSYISGIKTVPRAIVAPSILTDHPRCK